ncbi:hypothetical protein M501DRAFT_986012 [Patellaria atrata CBS 101060]|uniref:Uncharacterized protein n=1 Tax=Patellaria atrata CBS 101060 TaxID=1346257 RepID=A0A9P4VRQ7_9PEZI|nr:hypothetical protein M501DRAFT_986012 [Patellaria atrata CBS 101060]
MVSTNPFFSSQRSTIRSVQVGPATEAMLSGRKMDIIYRDSYSGARIVLVPAVPCALLVHYSLLVRNHRFERTLMITNGPIVEGKVPAAAMVWVVARMYESATTKSHLKNLLRGGMFKAKMDYNTTDPSKLAVVPYPRSFVDMLHVHHCISALDLPFEFRSISEDLRQVMVDRPLDVLELSSVCSLPPRAALRESALAQTLKWWVCGAEGDWDAIEAYLLKKPNQELERMNFLYRTQWKDKAVAQSLEEGLRKAQEEKRGQLVLETVRKDMEWEGLVWGWTFIHRD